MELIQQKIINYLNNNSIRDLMSVTNISCGVLYSIKNGDKDRGYRKNILDKLYLFFSIPKDEFYKKSIIVSTSKNYLGQFFKLRREKLGFSKNQVAKMIKGEERHVRRFENGYINYNPNSYYFKNLLEVYNLNNDEKDIITNYVNSLQKIIKLEKNENVLYLN